MVSVLYMFGEFVIVFNWMAGDWHGMCFFVRIARTSSTVWLHMATIAWTVLILQSYSPGGSLEGLFISITFAGNNE